MIWPINRTVIRTMLPVAITATLCVLTLVFLYSKSKETITDNSEKHLLKTIETMIPVDYNNSIYNDFIETEDPTSPITHNITRIYRIRKDHTDIGVIYIPVTAEGYNGIIKLAISIAKQGNIMAVNVIDQKESSGLGDQIDNQNSGWLEQFTGHSLIDTSVQQWQVKEDDGVFDAVSGATITSRGVTLAIRLTLEHYMSNSDILYRRKSTINR